MNTYVEPTRGTPLRDNNGQAQRSHINIPIQGAPEQSPDNEVQEKTSLNKLFAKRTKQF